MPSNAPLRPALPAPLAAALLLLAAACGETRAPGGFGDLDRRPDASPVLLLEGTPYEMGWWHGRLLRREIVEGRAAAEARLFERMGVAGDGEAARAQRAALEAHLELCVDQSLMRLSERMLQELDGMAAATGLPREALVQLDVMRDALRMKGLETSWEGAAGLAPTDGGYEARAWWRGAEVARYGPRLVVHRKPAGRPETVCLTWPGSLGAVAAVTADGRGYLLAEVEVHDKRRMGFGGGRPFHVAAREALDQAADAGDVVAASTATMGHLLLAFAARPGQQPPVEAVAAVQVFMGTSEEIHALGDDPFVAVGPYEEGLSPDARALQEAVVRTPGLSTEERFQRLRVQVGAAERPAATITFRAGRARLHFLSPGGEIGDVELDPAP